MPGWSSLPREFSTSRSMFLLVSQFDNPTGSTLFQICHEDVLTDIRLGIPAANSGALAFFLIQPVGMMMEDLLKLVLAPLQAHLQISEGISRCIGALWVLLWMTWTVPWYMYPIVAAGSGDDGVIPVSVILYIKSLLS